MFLGVQKKLFLIAECDTTHNACVALLDLAVCELMFGQHTSRSERFIADAARQIARVDVNLHVFVILSARFECLAAEHAGQGRVRRRGSYQREGRG